jgi:hypothetical protein
MGAGAAVGGAVVVQAHGLGGGACCHWALACDHLLHHLLQRAGLQGRCGREDCVSHELMASSALDAFPLEGDGWAQQACNNW